MSANLGPGAKELYEFGPFRVDPQKEVLLRAGEPVSLTPKTFQILLVLVRHSKEVVTKDDLMKTVWPDTFVEEANLSRNIFMLRRALGESPQDRYIVTVPGRGYRLAESVQLVPQHEIRIVAAKHSKVQVQVEETKPWRWISLAAILLLAVAVGTFRSFWHHTMVANQAVLSEKDTVVLADFANSTGDPVFDMTLRQGMAVQLQQSPFLSLISDERIRRTMQMMGRPADERLTPDIAREICERTGSAAVLEGSIASLGNEYVLGFRARNCSSGDVLDEQQALAARKEDALNALSQIANKFRTRAGESFATIQQHQTPLVEATTPSIEALKAYSTGMKVAFSDSFAAAVPHLKRAIEIDPKFAVAYAQLGLLYSDIGESVLATESTIKAYQLRDRASDPERFFITVNYERHVTRNLDKARQTCELWAQTYPRDPSAHALLAGLISQGSGKYQESIDEAKKALSLDPDFTPGYVNLAYSYFWLDRPGDAQNVLRRAAERQIEVPELLLLRYDTAFLSNDRPGMDREVALAQGKPEAEDWLANSQALILARSGHLLQAIQMSNRAFLLAERTDRQETAATYETAPALWEAFFGNSREARRTATKALDLSKGRDVEFGAAFALALAGDSVRAQALTNDLDKRFPEDTSVRFNYLPALRGLLALKRGEPSRAIEELQVAIPNESAVPGITFFASFGAFYPAYVRGEAYLASHRAAGAAAEFEKILDHRGIVFGDPIGALAYLQLGRALALSGEKTEANTAYQNFFTLWKDADPNIPILSQAKAEYAKLQ